MRQKRSELRASALALRVGIHKITLPRYLPVRRPDCVGPDLKNHLLPFRVPLAESAPTDPRVRVDGGSVQPAVGARVRPSGQEVSAWLPPRGSPSAVAVH